MEALLLDIAAGVESRGVTRDFSYTEMFRNMYHGDPCFPSRLRLYCLSRTTRIWPDR